MTSYRLSRRALLVAGTAALATPHIARAAAKSIVVANTGGAFEAALDAAMRQTHRLPEFSGPFQRYHWHS